MLLARIQGNATATIAHPSLRGVPLLVCETLAADGSGTGKLFLGADFLGAGQGATVLVTADGEAASRKVKDRSCPLRNVILALVDDPVPSNHTKQPAEAP